MKLEYLEEIIKLKKIILYIQNPMTTNYTIQIDWFIDKNNVICGYGNTYASLFFSQSEIIYALFLIGLIVLVLFFNNIGFKKYETKIAINLIIAVYLAFMHLIVFYMNINTILTFYLNSQIESITLFNGQVKISMLSFLFKSLISFSAFVYSLIIFDHVKYYKTHSDYQLLIIIPFTCLGGFFLVQANDLINAFLSMEIIAISLYCFIVSKEKGKLTTESGIKYYIIGSSATAIMLWGLSIIYLHTGSINFEEIKVFLTISRNHLSSDTQWFIFGIFLIFLSILIKIGIVPFHLWVPEVYGGASLMIMMFISLIPKIAYFGFLVNIMYYVLLSVRNLTCPIFLTLGLLTMFIGIIGAYNQDKIRKFLAYSMLSNTGLFISVLAIQSTSSLRAFIFSIIIYLVLMVNLFSSFLVLRDDITGRPAETFDELRKLHDVSPILALNITATLLSLSGLPIFAGFFMKIELLQVFITNAQLTGDDIWFLGPTKKYFPIILILIICMTLLSSFYYLRIIKFMLFERDIGCITILFREIGWPMTLILSFTFIINITLIFYSSILWNIVNSSIFPLDFTLYDAINKGR